MGIVFVVVCVGVFFVVCFVLFSPVGGDDGCGCEVPLVLFLVRNRTGEWEVLYEQNTKESLASRQTLPPPGTPAVPYYLPRTVKQLLAVQVLMTYSALLRLSHVCYPKCNFLISLIDCIKPPFVSSG